MSPAAYRVEFKPSAARAVRKLEPGVQRRVIARAEALADNPALVAFSSALVSSRAPTSDRSNRPLLLLTADFSLLAALIFCNFPQIFAEYRVGDIMHSRNISLVAYLTRASRSRSARGVYSQAADSAATQIISSTRLPDEQRTNQTEMKGKV